jgi:hypothetical protein
MKCIMPPFTTHHLSVPSSRSSLIWSPNPNSAGPGERNKATPHTHTQNFHIYLHLCSFCMVWVGRRARLSHLGISTDAFRGHGKERVHDGSLSQLFSQKCPSNAHTIARSTLFLASYSVRVDILHPEVSGRTLSDRLTDNNPPKSRGGLGNAKRTT